MPYKNIILDLLDEKLTSQVLFSIFVFGSRENYYFTQKNLEEIFYPDVTGNNTIRNKIKKIKPFFLETIPDKNDFHQFDRVDEKKDGSIEIKWTSKTTNKGNPLIPSFKWFEILFDIKLNKKQIDILFSFLQSVDFIPIKNRPLFPYHNFTNILEIIKEGLKSNYLNYHLGYWIFGDKFNQIKEEYILNYNKEIKLNKKTKGYDSIADENNNTSSLALKKTLKKYNLENRVNTYNINLIINSIYFSGISNEDIVHFNRLILAVFNIKDCNYDVTKFTENLFFVSAFSSCISEEQNWPYKVYEKIKI
ncbi:MAG: hypothetical protein WC996_02260 [Peptostreptococcales bacterium]|nr:hypothetical protein [Candidatus ainarchaeum sp.]